MADDKAKGPGAPAAEKDKPAEQPDPRVLELVMALVPPGVGETEPTEEQTKLATAISKELADAGKKTPKVDKGATEEASAVFFAGSVASDKAHKAADEQAKKEAEFTQQAYAGVK